MLNSGEKIIFRKKNSERNKKLYPPPPVEWSIPKLEDGLKIENAK